MLRPLPLLVLLWVSCAAPLLGQTPVEAARTRALAGDRAGALALLQQRLVEAPADTDARTLYGTILSWEGRREEARAALLVVLDVHPVHGDALPALINVELWSGNYDRAEQLAARAVTAMPDRWDVRLQHARALDRLDRLQEARAELDHAVSLNPERQDVRVYRRALTRRLAKWNAGALYGLEAFDDGREPWHEVQLSLSRQTRAGALGVRGYHAQRFGSEDQQIELEAYPSFGDGTYGYLAAAFADEAGLYPKRRYAADLHQALGGGFEGALGMRRLEFTDATHIYVGSIAKYQADYLFQGRVFYASGDRDQVTWQAGGRRYLRDGTSYLGLRYSHGSWREDIRDLVDLDRLGSNSVTIETSLDRRRLTTVVQAAVGREERTSRAPLWRGALTVGLTARF